MSGVGGAESSKTFPFQAAWEKSQGNEFERTPCSIPIPGHARSGKSGKSKNSLPKSPSSLGKSPKSPKSPSSLAGLTDEELKKLKDSLVAESELVADTSKDDTLAAKKQSVVKFEEDFPPLS